MQAKHWIIFIIFLSGCASLGIMEWDQRFGESTPKNRLTAANITSSQTKQYNQQVKPIIENRCVVCHGCFDAPCQLKMESPEAIERGAHKAKVYDGARLRAIKPSTLASQSVDSWREQNFFPVLNERQQSPIANLEASVFYQMLKLKQEHPLPKTQVLGEEFDFRLDRDQQCPSIEEFEQYRTNYPLAGMPYGLPALTKQEHQTLTTWLQTGAKFPKPAALTPHEENMVVQWELLLNQEDLKTQLIARYLFEHLYLANLYFESDKQRYFTLLRSSTPPGKAIEPIVTRRPYDEPNTNRVYYRLQKNEMSITAKRHMPYAFDDKKLARIKALFFTPSYEVTSLPSYDLKLASNPFKTFAQLPAKSRYQFMLDEAQFSIMNFIKGPVCRGQIALNVIEDHFWVFFEDPDNIDYYHVDTFINENSDLLQLPASTSSNVLSIIDWRKYANRQEEFVRRKLSYVKEIELRQSDVDIDLLWTGKGNKNAVLTVYRHFDSATVLRGAIGEKPKTSWVIGYPLLERIHYLLVAGFDIYGDLAHQLKTRLYMDFLRMEGESKFIHLLPKKERKAVYQHWYRDTDETLLDYIFSENFNTVPETNIEFSTQEHQSELYDKLLAYTQESLNQSYHLTNSTNGYKLKRLAHLSGENLYLLPQLSYLYIKGNERDEVYSLINNSGHANVAHLFAEEDRRLPQEDTLDIVKGIIGAYPNAFFQIKAEQLGEFIIAMENIRTQEDYSQFKSTYGVGRTSPNFWQFSDKLHNWYQTNHPLAYGLLDYNRLENR